MPLTLHFHPLASFCHKVLIALHEASIPFDGRIIDLGNRADRAALAALWPIGKFPVLRDDERDRTLPESTIIVEYLSEHYPSAAGLLPPDATARLDVRLWDRVFDSYVQEPMQKIVGDRLRGPDERDARGVADARAALQGAYELLEQRLPPGGWAAGETFTLADCAAAPALFYATIVEPLPAGRPALQGYIERLMDRPSVRRTLDHARPYFKFFPYKEALPARFRADA